VQVKERERREGGSREETMTSSSSRGSGVRKRGPPPSLSLFSISFPLLIRDRTDPKGYYQSFRCKRHGNCDITGVSGRRGGRRGGVQEVEGRGLREGADSAVVREAVRQTPPFS